MGIESRLEHRISIIRRVAMLTGETPLLDEDGHVLLEEQVIPGVAAAIQPRREQERPSEHQAGAAIGTHRLYTVDRRIGSAEALIHDPLACPVPTPRDLPRLRFEVHGTADAAGRGHHLEIDASTVGPHGPVPVTGGSGS